MTIDTQNITDFFIGFRTEFLTEFLFIYVLNLIFIKTLLVAEPNSLIPKLLSNDHWNTSLNTRPTFNNIGNFGFGVSQPARNLICHQLYFINCLVRLRIEEDLHCEVIRAINLLKILNTIN